MARRRDAADADAAGGLERERTALFGAPSRGKAPRVTNAPIFALDRDDHWRSVPGLRLGSVRLLAAGGGTVVLVTGDGTILRWGVDRDQPPDGEQLPGRAGRGALGGATSWLVGWPPIHASPASPPGGH